MQFWRENAVSNTWLIESAKWHKGTHDLGFMIGDSFGKAYQLTGEQSYRDVMLQAARTLCTRYSPKVGCIRSWDHNADRWTFPVIIDNMMNLEILFEAYKLTGDKSFYDIAVSHANVTMKNHFRDDYSSYHVVDYDPVTGTVRSRVTHQGYSDDSFGAVDRDGHFMVILCAIVIPTISVILSRLRILPNSSSRLIICRKMVSSFGI